MYLLQGTNPLPVPPVEKRDPLPRRLAHDIRHIMRLAFVQHHADIPAKITRNEQTKRIWFWKHVSENPRLD